MKFLSSYLILLSLIFSLQSNAQKENNHQCDLTVLAWDQKAQQLNPTLWSGKKELVKKLSINSLRRSQTIKYKGDGKLTITTNSNMLQPDTEKYKLSTVSINPQWRRCLVIIRADSKSKTGFRISAIDDSVSSFKWGSYRFINNTGRELGFQIDKKKLALKKSPKSLRTFSPNWVQKNFSCSVWVRGRKNPVYTSIWEHHPEKRSLIIIEKSKNARLGLVSIKVVEERKPVAPVVTPSP